MANTNQPNAIAPARRIAGRRLLLASALLIFTIVAAWMTWGAIQDYLDTRALHSYFTDFDHREPNWRDRVYGRELTDAQHQDHDRWKELQQLFKTNDSAWMLNRMALKQNLYENPSLPTDLLTVEQAEWLETAHQYWKPVTTKLLSMQWPPTVHRWIDRKAPYQDMVTQSYGPFHYTAYQANELAELEVIYNIQNNKPRQTVDWLARCVPVTPGYANFPSLVDRWLNLTQPDLKDLVLVEKLVSNHIIDLENQVFQYLGSDIRLMQKLVDELSLGELSQKQLEQSGIAFMLIPNNSSWRTGWLQTARPWYLNWRIHSLFRRRDHIVLRLHQLADVVEGLSRVEPTTRWAKWLEFVRANSLDSALVNTDKSVTVGTDQVPAALSYLRAGYLHSQIVNLFNQNARLHAIWAALLAERFRLDHGRFPNDWNELVPQYRSEPVLDPFTGKPLQIRQIEKKLAIYSIGRDRKDEGGTTIGYNRWRQNGLSLTNPGMYLYLPEHRRSSPATLEADQIAQLKRSSEELKKLLKPADTNVNPDP